MDKTQIKWTKYPNKHFIYIYNIKKWNSLKSIKLEEKVSKNGIVTYSQNQQKFTKYASYELPALLWLRYICFHVVTLM